MNDETRKFFEKLAGVSDNDNDNEFEVKLAKAERVKEEEEDEELTTDDQQSITKDKDKDKDGKKEEDSFDEGEGSLAIDVYQTENDIVVMAPIAGVAVDDLDIDITPDSVSIKGKREKREKIEKKDFLYSECYWGKFSRSIILPQEINPDHAAANFKNGVLKIVLPKLSRTKAKKMKIKFD